MRLLITGGAGFIGSNLARLALSREHDVVIIDALSTGYRDNLEDIDVTFIEGSILDENKLREAMKGVDSVVHLAVLGSVPRSIKKPAATHDQMPPARSACSKLRVTPAWATSRALHRHRSTA